MEVDRKEIAVALRELVNRASETAGTVVLVSSTRQAQSWKDIAEVVDGESITTVVSELVNRTKNGPIVMANRYDGIDLPGDSCRFLVLSGLPVGSNTYDLYRATVFEGSSTANTGIAQRIEQGMGRGTRGAGDHCVVVLAGSDLATWVSNRTNRALLTSPTRVQLEMGMETSQNIRSFNQFRNVASQSFDRDQAWVEYHAEVLAEEISSPSINELSLSIAGQERRFFQLLLDDNYDKAITHRTHSLRTIPRLMLK